MSEANTPRPEDSEFAQPGSEAEQAGAAGGEALRLLGLWEALGAAEDWLAGPADFSSGWGGPRRLRAVPDFSALLAAREARGAAAPPSGGPRDGLPAEAELAQLAEEAAACRACRLGGMRRNCAFGEGAARPLVLVVGEGPGEEEDAQGRPFVGPAGRLLDKMLAAVQLSREENCYIANIVKCRPPGNRDPAPDERAACLPFLERQLELLRPAVILAMGRVAAQALLETTEGITRLRGRWFERGGIPLLATYHPSAVLRDEALKRPVWEDLKLLRERLNEGAGNPGDTGNGDSAIGDSAIGDTAPGEVPEALPGGSAD